MDGILLTPNEIPRKEPKVRIGIILPTDSIKTLRCSFSDPQCYEIETSTKILPSCKNEKEFNIQISDRNIVIPELSLKDKNIKLIPSILDEIHLLKLIKFLLDEVSIGRKTLIYLTGELSSYHILKKILWSSMNYL